MEEINIDNLFDRRATFPDSGAKKRFELLVGLDEVKDRLIKSLAVLVNPDGVQAWAKKFHSTEMSLLDFAERRPPLVILAGDVGTGKTEVASTVGDAVARQENIAVITARADDRTQKDIICGIAEAAFATDTDVVVFSNIYNR